MAPLEGVSVSCWSTASPGLPAARQPHRRTVAPWSTRMPAGPTPGWADGVTADRSARRAGARPFPW